MIYEPGAGDAMKHQYKYSTLGGRNDVIWSLAGNQIIQHFTQT